MEIKKQPNGTAIGDEERKVLTALLVKLGYCVSVRREKSGGVSATVIRAEEQR